MIILPKDMVSTIILPKDTVSTIILPEPNVALLISDTGLGHYTFVALNPRGTAVRTTMLWPPGRRWEGEGVDDGCGSSPDSSLCHGLTPSLDQGI